MTKRFDWKKLAEIAECLDKGYSLCPKHGTMWLGPEPACCPTCQAENTHTDETSDN